MDLDEARQLLAEAIALTIELCVLTAAGLPRLDSPEPLYDGSAGGLSHRTDRLDQLILCVYQRLNPLHKAVGGSEEEISSLATIVDWRQRPLSTDAVN